MSMCFSSDRLSSDIHIHNIVQCAECYFCPPLLKGVNIELFECTTRKDLDSVCTIRRVSQPVKLFGPKKEREGLARVTKEDVGMSTLPTYSLGTSNVDRRWVKSSNPYFMPWLPSLLI